MTTQHRKLLTSRIALALRDEFGRQPTETEIERYSRLAAILFKSVGGVLAMKNQMQKYNQIPIWK